MFFSNLKYVNIGDKVYITDVTGTKIEYTVYNKYVTSTADTGYFTRNAGENREISLKTCTDDATENLIIWARQ